jgi:SPP1 gp7 family putative phage head morphogenesis protein
VDFSKKEIDALMEGIYSGEITEYELPENLYFAIADYLKSNLYKGFGIKFDKLSKQIAEGVEGAFDTKDLALLTELRENIYIFSGSKLFQQTLQYRDALLDENGDLKPLDTFKEDFQSIYGQYNETWLETEYNTTYGQAQNAVRWNQIEKDKDVLPYLTYSAVVDGRTSEICLPLDGISLPVDDPFWNTFMPENHYNCRCTVQQHDDENLLTNQDEVDAKAEETGSMMDDSFKFNVGKTGEIFPKDHPYFDVPKEYKGLAKENFNLPIPEED